MKDETGIVGNTEISDHFDGTRFFNPPVHDDSRGLKEVIRWRTESKRVPWPASRTNLPFAPPPNAVAPGGIGITFINHATFLLRFASTVILTDPIFSERCSPLSFVGPKRVRPPGIAIADLPRPDLVLISHNHYDHMDLPSLREIRRRHQPQFITTLGNARALRSAGIDAVELDWWHSHNAGAAVITSTPARHFSARTPFDRNRALWGGFMIQTGGTSLLFAGDSGAGHHWADIRARLGVPQIALLPIGAYEPRWFMGPVHMDPGEAVQAHLALGAPLSIGMHFGTFQLTDEGIDDPLTALATARGASGIDPAAFRTLGFGETYLHETCAGTGDNK